MNFLIHECSVFSSTGLFRVTRQFLLHLSGQFLGTLDDRLNLQPQPPMNGIVSHECTYVFASDVLG